MLTLGENIKRYGGKHGGLLHFRENVDGGGNKVLPFELLDPEQKFTWETRRRVWAACKETGAEGVIIRTSEQSDWKGMVDTMPTIVSGKWSLSIMRAISKARRACEHPQLLEYARREGNGYDPGKVTLSITPYFPPSKQSPRILTTQHPSIENAHLADVFYPYDDNTDWLKHSSFDFDGQGKLSWAYSGESEIENAKAASELGGWVEQTGVLPGNEAFQFEGGIIQGKPRLFQVRYLGDKRSADFKLDHVKTRPYFRDFGVTPPEGVTLTAVCVETRDEFAEFEAENPGTKYVLVANKATEQLKITDQPTNMKGYMIKDKPALSHQATRLVQMCLRDSHGVTSLFSLDKIPKLKDGARVRIIADGVRQSIEMLD